MKINSGYCPFCGEFITTQLNIEMGDIIVVKHGKFITLYHQKCYEFNYGNEKTWSEDAKEINEHGH